jgi:RNA recognition motif-containing protein
MSFTVFLGNLPVWVTADDIRGWLTAENLVADAIKVIRNPETQESKGFAFIEAPNTEEMNAIIRRFDRAPLEDRLLRANPAQPPKPRGQIRPSSGPGGASGPGGHGTSASQGSASQGSAGQGSAGQGAAAQGSSAGQVSPAVSPSNSGAGPSALEQRPPRRGKKSAAKKPASNGGNSSSAFAEELAKAL